MQIKYFAEDKDIFNGLARLSELNELPFELELEEAAGQGWAETGINLVDLKALEKKLQEKLPKSAPIVLIHNPEEIPENLAVPLADVIPPDCDLLMLKKRLPVWQYWVEFSRKMMVQKDDEVSDDLAGKRAEFLALVGHEFRTPLAVVSTALSTLSAQLKDSADDEIYEILEQAQKSSQKLRFKLDLISEVLKLQRQSLPEPVEEVDLKSTIISIVPQLKPILKNQNIEMGFRLKEELWTVGNPQSLYRLFEQLLSNAIRYTPSGGKIVIAGTRAGKRVVIAVSDTGIGLPESSRKRLFDPFAIGYAWENHQSDEEDPNGGSLGLGLYLCKRIVELHDGKIWAESAGENKGSKFFVALPALD